MGHVPRPCIADPHYHHHPATALQDPCSRVAERLAEPSSHAEGPPHAARTTMQEDSLPPRSHGLRVAAPPDDNLQGGGWRGLAEAVPRTLSWRSREAAQEEGFFVVVASKGENDICVPA